MYPNFCKLSFAFYVGSHLCVDVFLNVHPALVSSLHHVCLKIFLALSWCRNPCQSG